MVSSQRRKLEKLHAEDRRGGRAGQVVNWIAFKLSTDCGVANVPAFPLGSPRQLTRTTQSYLIIRTSLDLKLHNVAREAHLSLSRILAIGHDLPSGYCTVTLWPLSLHTEDALRAHTGQKLKAQVGAPSALGPQTTRACTARLRATYRTASFTGHWLVATMTASYSSPLSLCPLSQRIFVESRSSNVA